MLAIPDLYIDYTNRTPEELTSQALTTLSGLLGSGYSETKKKIQYCIDLTREYTNKHQKDTSPERFNSNGEYVRKSGEPYINHVLRVALILIHERLFDTNVLRAAIMHDLFEDTDFTYENACALFNKEVADLMLCVTNVSESNLKSQLDEYISSEEIDYAGIVNRCSSNKMALYIKFADRLDNLMTMESMPPEKQAKKVKATEDYMYPLLKQLQANRFLTYIENAVFNIKERLSNNPSEYDAVQSRLNHLCVFTSVEDTFRHIFTAFCSPNKSLDNKRPFKDARLQFPTIYELARHFKEKNIKLDSFNQSDLYFKIFLISNDEVIPDYKSALEIFLSSVELSEYAIEQITSAGFNFIDDIRNHYRVILTTSDAFNLQQYGSTEVDLPITTPEKIDDDFYAEQIEVFTPDQDQIRLPKGSTVIDFAFKIHQEVGDRMIGARVNGRNVSIKTPLKENDVVDIIITDYPQSLTQLNWIMHCVTKNAKRCICKIIQIRLNQI